MISKINTSSVKIYLNQSHLDLFAKLVEAWASYFGVRHRWEIHVSFGDDENEAGGVLYKILGRIATITITNPHDDIRQLTPMEMSRIACHEVVHLLLAPLADWADEGTPRGLNINGIEHEIVHTLVLNSLAHVGNEILESCSKEVSVAFGGLNGSC